jgi:hypothetical protein
MYTGYFNCLYYAFQRELKMEIDASIYTVCDMLNPSNLARLGEVLDVCPIATVTRMDTNDPLRRKVSGFREGLLGILGDNPDKNSLWINSTSGGKERFESYYRLNPFGQAFALSGLSDVDNGHSGVSLNLFRQSINKKEIDEFKKLFVGVAIASEAFYGMSTELTMYTQRTDLMQLAAVNMFNVRSYPDYSRELPDVYWLNYFGPAYVELWGQKKVDKLSEKYLVEKLGNGGICVQTTPEVVFADCSIRRITDYAFKRHFYMVLGKNTFMHETQRPGRRGKYVPRIEAHRQIILGQQARKMVEI